MWIDIHFRWAGSCAFAASDAFFRVCAAYLDGFDRQVDIAALHKIPPAVRLTKILT